MKHLLIASSMLALTAGFASAEITFGGTATAGVATNSTSNGGATDNTAPGPDGILGTADDVAGDSALLDDAYHVYSSFNLVVTGVGTSDFGLSFGATMDLTAGVTYKLADDDGFNDEGATLGMPTVYVSGSFGKVSFSSNNFDFYDDSTTDSNGDVKYENTFGGFGLGVIADIEGSKAAVQATYTLMGVALSADYNQETAGGDDPTGAAQWNVSAAYTMGAITGTATAFNTIAGNTGETAKLAYSANGMSASVKYETAVDANVAQFDVAAGYTSGGLSVNLSADDVLAANHSTAHWTATASYALGTGMSLEGGTNYTGDVMAGVKMTF